MTYTRNAIYDRLESRLEREFPHIYVSSVYEPVPASFPAVFVRETGMFSNDRNISISGLQNVWTSTFEIQIQSNLENGASQEVFDILDIVHDEMITLYYVLINRIIVDNGATSGIFRMATTYRRITGAADEMPEMENQS